MLVGGAAATGDTCGEWYVQLGLQRGTGKAAAWRLVRQVAMMAATELVLLNGLLLTVNLESDPVSLTLNLNHPEGEVGDPQLLLGQE